MGSAPHSISIPNIYYFYQIKVEAKADISLEDDKSIDLSPVEDKSNNLSMADEIDLNSDNEFRDDHNDIKTKPVELRSEPEDIFEDIPEPKDNKIETMPQPPFQPTAVTPRKQVRNSLVFK